MQFVGKVVQDNFSYDFGRKIVGKVGLDNFSNEFHVFSIQPEISQNHDIGGKSYPGQLFIMSFLVGNRRNSCAGQAFLPILGSNRVARLFCRIIRSVFYWLRHRPYTQDPLILNCT